MCSITTESLLETLWGRLQSLDHHFPATHLEGELWRHVKPSHVHSTPPLYPQWVCVCANCTCASNCVTTYIWCHWSRIFSINVWFLNKDKSLKKILSTIITSSHCHFYKKYFKRCRDLLAEIQYKIVQVMFSLHVFHLNCTNCCFLYRRMSLYF